MGTQLTLGIQLRDDCTLESYYPGKNIQVLRDLITVASGDGEQFTYIFGPDGVGKSHLLQAVCHSVVESGGQALYMPLSDYKQMSPAILQGLDTISTVCLDDIENIASNPYWEEAVFHLFNHLKASGKKLVVSSNISPFNIDINLKDLKSRLAWGVAYQLQPLDDDDKVNALKLRASIRGMDLNKNVGKFLLSRCPRNMRKLFMTLEKLDKVSLEKQRKLTIPFVKQVLNV